MSYVDGGEGRTKDQSDAHRTGNKDRSSDRGDRVSSLSHLSRLRRQSVKSGWGDSGDGPSRIGGRKN